ncbi:GTPase [Crenothrix sp.]|uniref:GTPase n=1 Tax=Crenothrix sp. TaxID=3100433 RepID=UPI00374C92A0
MASDYSDLVEKTKQWAAQASALGWINSHCAEQLSEFDARTPDSLFNHNTARPLIVAFMGGTGVGKSSLLNRLAKKSVAKTGVERPTSREVTLYHHQSVTINNLPEKLPIDRITIAQHDDESKKDIIWIDMPDFDSTEQSNKHLVLEWLPQIDVLIYVVSPERYRDEKAWRLLLSEGNRHAWLFVLNQWDRGQSEQYEDFKQQLGKAGFVEPIIFKTICADSSQPDEFDALHTTITSLANANTVKQLKQRSMQVRKDELKQKLQQSIQALGSTKIFQQAPEIWHKQWEQTTNLLQQGFDWPIKKLATYYAEHAGHLISNSATNTAEKAELALWDEWAQARFSDALDQFIHNTDQLGLPATPFKKELALVREKAPKIVQTQSELAVRQALANPGNALQRGFLKLMRVLEFVLPLLSISWVAYQVFVGYYQSNMTDVEYLGIDFAVHSSLLVIISWLAPWFIRRQLKPSLEKSVLNGLKKGLDTAITLIDGEVIDAVSVIDKQHSQQIKHIATIIEQCAMVDSQQSPIATDNPLSRMLVN